MRFTHRFRVKAPIEQVAAFHSRSSSMAAITPPPMVVRVHAAPPSLSSGGKMDFTLWAGPLPIRWLARIEDVSLHGFTDTQVSGPFRSWKHRHDFERVAENVTEVVDTVDVVLKRHIIWGPVGAVMWLGMPLLFAYRARKTKRLLKSSRD